jgi:hypothetical protein
VRQSHECTPATTVDAYFASRPAELRAICDAVVGVVADLGPVVVEAVSVGILLKRSRTFAELRPRRDGLVLSCLLSEVVEHPRVIRVTRTSANRAAIFVGLRRVDDVDEEVCDWLAEAYLSSPA